MWPATVPQRRICERIVSLMLTDSILPKVCKHICLHSGPTPPRRGQMQSRAVVFRPQINNGWMLFARAVQHTPIRRGGTTDS